jgi:hypothetical protein
MFAFFQISFQLFLSSSDTSSTTSSNQTHFATCGGISSHRGRLTNMLMVTTTVWMFYRLKSNNMLVGEMGQGWGQGQPLSQLFKKAFE